MNYLDQISRIVKNPVRLECSSKKYNMFVLKSGDETIAGFQLKEMPGCCGVCISYHAFVTSNYRGQGIGTLLNSMRIQMAHDMEYGAMICTVVSDNGDQQQILKKNNWRKVEEFENPKTDNLVEIYVVKVKNTGFEVGVFVEYLPSKAYE